MPPSQLLSLPSYLLARTYSDEPSHSLNAKPTSDKKLSTAAGAAILIVFAIFVITVCLTISICVARSKRRSRAKETEERNRAAGMQDMEVEGTVGDWGSAMGIVKGEVKSPQRCGSLGGSEAWVGMDLSVGIQIGQGKSFGE